MIKETYICIQNLLIGFGIVSYFIFNCNIIYNNFTIWLSNHIYVYCICFYIIVNIIISIFYRGNDWQIAIYSCFLGSICGCGLIISIVTPAEYKPFGIYIIIFSTFHYSEYLVTSITNPENLSLSSFLLNHSVSYWLAAIASWSEFFLECWLIPTMKKLWYITVVGLFICIIGEIIRKLAMLTAKKNFNHVVQTVKHKDHQLVTWGIFRFFRHPSYVGWFWWSLGTQIVLINPFCLIAYAVASWRFFYERVQLEEMALIKFFGNQYINYMKKVGTGLPFIMGYNIDIIDHND